MTRDPRLPIVVATCALTFAWVANTRTQDVLDALPRDVASPADNPMTPEKVALGRLLFWDPLLSGSKDVACATCHHPDFGYADNRDVAIGTNGVGLGRDRHFPEGNTIPLVKRNSPTVLNAAFNGIDPTGHYKPDAAPMFWDMRVRSLEAQALEPIKALPEMRGEAYAETDALETIVSRVAAVPEYRDLFAGAFGPKTQVSAATLGKAIAAFERSLVTPNSPFDRYMRGDANAMTPLQIQGMQRFEDIGCANCHSGPMLSDYKAHVLGVPDNAKLPASDTGVNNTYAFRTPALRNVALTAPYMHNGVFRTLDQVVQFYNNVRGGGRGGRGGRGPGGGGPGGPPPGGGGGPSFGRGGGGRGGAINPNVNRGDLDPLLRRLNVGRGRQDLVAFLQALTDDRFDRAIPSRVPSGLSVGGTIRP